MPSLWLPQLTFEMFRPVPTQVGHWDHNRMIHLRAGSEQRCLPEVRIREGWWAHWRETVQRGLPGISMEEKYCLEGFENHRWFCGPRVSWDRNGDGILECTI